MLVIQKSGLNTCSVVTTVGKLPLCKISYRPCKQQRTQWWTKRGCNERKYDTMIYKYQNEVYRDS